MEFSRPDRFFKLWYYTVSHKTMLFRSDPRKFDTSKTRIEIYVGAVDLMYLHPMYDGLTIRRAVGDEHSATLARHGIEAEPGTLYLLESSSGNGFLVSGRPSWREAVRKIDDPTLFDFSQAWPPEESEMSWGDVE